MGPAEQLLSVRVHENVSVSFALPPEVEELETAARRFGAEVLAPNVREHEKAGRWPDVIVRVLDGFSLRDLDVPAELGGAGAGCLAKVVLLESLAGGDAGGLPAADQPGPALGAVLACPDRALARDVLDACTKGEAQVVLTVVDAEAPGALRIEWAPSWPPLRWAWVSEGDDLRLLEVAALPGNASALAFHASGGSSVSLAGSRVVGEWRLGDGAGVSVRGRARLWMAAVAVGVAQAAFDATVAYTTERVVFGKPVAYHQGNAFELAGLATNVHGSRLGVRDAASSYDVGDPDAGFWATQAWLTAVETAVAVTDAGIQLLGGHGFLVDHLAEKRFREAKMLGLLVGGRDLAEADVAGLVLGVSDPVFADSDPVS